jgi:uncharacterized protein YhaN
MGIKVVFNSKVATSLKDIRVNHLKDIKEDIRVAKEAKEDIKEASLNISTRVDPNKAIRAVRRRKTTKQVRRNKFSREEINTSKVRSLSTKVPRNTKAKLITQEGHPQPLNIPMQKYHNHFTESLC